MGRSTGCDLGLLRQLTSVEIQAIATCRDWTLTEYSSGFSMLPLSRSWVLLIEDQIDAKDVLTFAFESAGAQVIAVDSVQSALQVLDCFIPKLIVSSSRFTGAEGSILASRVKHLEAKIGKSIPVLVITQLASNSASATSHDPLQANWLTA